jgi:membrane associated rhomboid family serine protease
MQSMAEDHRPKQSPNPETAEQADDEREIGLPGEPAAPPDQDPVTSALVLAARGIPFRPPPTAAGKVRVPLDHYPAARRELDLYAEENRDWPPAPEPRAVRPHNNYATLTVLALLALFHNLTQSGFGEMDWYRLGSAAAGLLVTGEWWRAVTALTLHADLLHLFGNLFLGAPLIIGLCRQLGSGLTWSLLLAVGAFGNLTNALLQSPGHQAVGFSTALFGALGLLAGLGLLRGKVAGIPRWTLPLAAALALLALLGTGGERTDVGAHLFGFFWGLLLGVPVGLQVVRGGIPRTGANYGLGLLAALLVGAAWGAALSHG